MKVRKLLGALFKGEETSCTGRKGSIVEQECETRVRQWEAEDRVGQGRNNTEDLLKKT